MVPYGSLQHIFDKPSNTPASWKHHNHMIEPVHHSRSSFLDPIHEPRFMEKNGSVQPTTSNNIDQTTGNGYFSNQCNVGMNAESLSMCTEGLGSESFDAVEHSKDEEDMNECFDHTTEKHAVSKLGDQLKRCRMKEMELPPPISSIGLSGKPWICLESYRGDGRFVLKEVRIPNQELLHARREDGRLKLQFVQSDDEQFYEEDEDEDENEEHLKVDIDGDYGVISP